MYDQSQSVFLFSGCALDMKSCLLLLLCVCQPVLTVRTIWQFPWTKSWFVVLTGGEHCLFLVSWSFDSRLFHFILVKILSFTLCNCHKANLVCISSGGAQRGSSRSLQLHRWRGKAEGSWLWRNVQPWGLQGDRGRCGATRFEAAGQTSCQPPAAQRHPVPPQLDLCPRSSHRRFVRFCFLFDTNIKNHLFYPLWVCESFTTPSRVQ